MILPRPNRAFEWTDTTHGQPALVCRLLRTVARHAFTMRSWRLGSAGTGSEAEDGWLEVARAMDVGADRLLRVRQVHGSAVVVDHGGPSPAGLPEADVLASDDRHAAIAVQAADCVPLLIGDVRSGSVAAAHAGWRGLALRVPSVAVGAMADAFGTRPSDLIAAIGPSIGACCYEVGDDVRRRFEAAGFSEEKVQRWFRVRALTSPRNPPLRTFDHDGRAGRWFLDMWAVSRDQLVAAGVPEDRVFVAELCTASHPGVFCSYRRDGAAAGRLAAAIRRL